MKQADHASLKKEIKDQMVKLQTELAELEENAKPVAPENSIGRISRMDAINNKSVVEASIRNRKKKTCQTPGGFDQNWKAGIWRMFQMQKANKP